MAEEIQIHGSGDVGKRRHPLGILGLMLITIGIYFFVWWFKVNKELAAIGKARGTDECGDNPTTSLLAMVPGFLIIVPPYVSFFNANKRLNAAERLTGRPEGLSPLLMLVIYFFISPVAIFIFQQNLNKVLEAQAGGDRPLAPPQAPPAAPEAPEQPAGTQQRQQPPHG